MTNVLDELKIEALKDSEVDKFIKDNKLSDEEIDKAILSLYRFVSSKRKCAKCEGLDECLLDSDGMAPHLKCESTISLVDKPCRFVDVDPQYLSLLYVPYEVPKGNLYTDDSDRSETYAYLAKYMQNPKKGKGIYLHGSFGTGKTFILFSIAKKLSSKGIRCVFVYYPDFARAIKLGIGSLPIEEIVNTCKYADVLMFDDIGGEGNSAFIRDDVLGPIVQARMCSSKPTFFTSNLSIEQLEEHLAESNKDINKAAASRVIERIRAVADEVELSGKNYR